MPPILVAMMAITDDLNAENHAQMNIKLLKGLITAGIKVISCAHDGTAVERRTQAKVIKSYKEDRLTFKIKHPLGSADIAIETVVIHNQPLVMVQDSKHTFKTFRNNLSSGARLLVLGNYIAMFHHLAEMVDCGGPSYPRDVY